MTTWLMRICFAIVLLDAAFVATVLVSQSWRARRRTRRAFHTDIATVMAEAETLLIANTLRRMVEDQ